MSPLRSSQLPSPIYISPNSYSSHTSIEPPPQDSDLSIDKYEEPKSKKQNLFIRTHNEPIQPSSSYTTLDTCSLYSSDKACEPEATTSTSQTKKTHNTITKKQINLYQDQIHAFKSAKISLQEFINIYNGIPTKFRDKKFRTVCRNYLYETSKTKTTFEEKKEMFLSLPKPLTTSIPLFKLMFQNESIMLLDIMSGKTDPKQLQTNIDKLLLFFPSKYLKRQLYQYIQQRQPLLHEDKSIVESCKKKLRLIKQKSETSKIQQLDKEQKHKQKLHPEAKAILDSLKDGTIDTKDITSHRKKLVLLGVKRNVIYNSFRRFRRSIQKSHRQDANEVLQIITESGRQAAKIKSAYMPTSDELQSMLDKAYSGILPLENIQNLRDLLFKEYTIEKATSYFQRAKKALIKHNKDNELLIQNIFKQTNALQPTKSNHYKCLQAKIKSGSLNVNTFTNIYDSIPQSDRTRSLNRLCARYIKNLSDTTTNVLEDKIKLLKSLPLPLQKYPSVLKTILPKESEIMSQIRTGLMPSCDLKTTFILLLKIISPQHAYSLLDYYLAKNKHLSTNDNNNIDACKALLKHAQHTTHKKSSYETRKRSSSESYNSPHEEYAIPSKNNKTDLHPQAKLILESLNNCSMKTDDIVKSRQQLILLKVDKGRIKREFYEFKQKIILSSRPDKQEIIKEIDKSGRTSRSIKTPKRLPTNRLSKLLISASKGTILLKDIKELRELLFREYKGAQASSTLYNAKTTLLRKRPQEEHDIKQAFVEASQIKRRKSKPAEDLKLAIHAGNLHVQEFTRLYSTTSVEDRVSCKRPIAMYVHHLSQQSQDLQYKLTTIQLLPKRLQASVATIKAFFPQQYEKISLIRSGKIKSEELQETCLKLSDVVSPTHIRALLSKYVTRKRTMTIEEKQHVAECRKLLLEMQKNKTYQSDRDIDEIQDKEASTSTSQQTKPVISITSTQTNASVEDKSDEGKQGTFAIQDNSKLVSSTLATCTSIKSPSHISTHYTNSWHTSAQPVSSEILVNILNEHTVNTQPIPLDVTKSYIIEKPITRTQDLTVINHVSPQPSTSYSSELCSETDPSFYIENLTSNASTCISKGIVDEDAAYEGHILLQHYLLQLANELQLDTVKQQTSNQEDEQPSTSQSITYTKTIDTQNTNNEKLSQIHEDFVHITDLAESLSHENFYQLANMLEYTTPLKETAPEDFFDFSNIDKE